MDADVSIIAWERLNFENDENLMPIMYIFPKSHEDFTKRTRFLVKEAEKAVLFLEGKWKQQYSAGLYDLEKKMRIKGTQIIWFDISRLKMQWGIPKVNGPQTKEGHKVGFNGQLEIELSDVALFYNKITGGKKEWILQDVKDWIIKNVLQRVFHQVVKEYSQDTLCGDGIAQLSTAINTKLTDELVSVGINLHTFSIIGCIK